MRTRELFTFSVQSHHAIAKKLPNRNGELGVSYEIRIWTGNRWARETLSFPFNMRISAVIRYVDMLYRAGKLQQFINT